MQLFLFRYQCHKIACFRRQFYLLCKPLFQKCEKLISIFQCQTTFTSHTYYFPRNRLLRLQDVTNKIKAHSQITFRKNRKDNEFLQFLERNSKEERKKMVVLNKAVMMRKINCPFRIIYRMK